MNFLRAEFLWSLPCPHLQKKWLYSHRTKTNSPKTFEVKLGKRSNSGCPRSTMQGMSHLVLLSHHHMNMSKLCTGSIRVEFLVRQKAAMRVFSSGWQLPQICMQPSMGTISTHRIH